MFFGEFAGVCWFGLLFFAGITSSLAMGTPWMGFMKDEFGWSKSKGAISFGIMTLIMGLPTVLFYQYGYFDEYDYWGGTVSLVVFALLETILFAWAFGINNGWEELNRGADIKIPMVYKWIIQYVTPVLLSLVFVGALITPENNDWVASLSSLSSGNGWALDHSSLIAKLLHTEFYEELADSSSDTTAIKQKIFYSNAARIQLLTLFATIICIVWYSSKKRLKTVL